MARAQAVSPDRDHRLESRMREIRPSGSEGGAAGGQTGRPYPYLKCDFVPLIPFDPTGYKLGHEQPPQKKNQHANE